MARRKEPFVPDALLDQLLAGADARSAFEPNSLLDNLEEALAERALNAELDHHLSDEPENSRNGYGRKTVLTDNGRLDLAIRRNRQATFDPRQTGRLRLVEKPDAMVGAVRRRVLQRSQMDSA